MNAKIIQVGGFFGIVFSVNKGEKQMISSLSKGELNLEGNEIITFYDRLLKKCTVDLAKYERDITIYAFSTKGSVRGAISAIIIYQDEFVDLINE